MTVRSCGLALCAAWLTCVVANAGELDESVASVVLEDFEREDADDDWSARQVEMSLFDRGVPDPGFSRAARLVYPQWTLLRGKWPAVILEHGEGQFRTSDWSLYSAFRLEARAHHSRVIHLKLRIDDGEGRRAIRILPIQPDRWTSCEVSLADLADDIDTEDVRRVDFFLSQPEAEYTIDLDDLRLEAGAIAIEEPPELTVDPFERGSMVVRARFNKRASWRIVVTDASGLQVAAYTGNGTRLHMRETLPLPASGRYTVTLHVLGHHGTTAVHTLGTISLGSGGRPTPGSAVAAWVEPSTRKVRRCFRTLVST